jgi:hypothetical protein
MEEEIKQKAKDFYPDNMGGLDQSSVERYRAGYMKGYKDALSEHPAGSNVWVKAITRLPGWDQLVEWRFAGKEPTAKETVRFLSNAANLHQWEWLDESNEQPVEQKENEAVAFVNWLHLNAAKISWDTGRQTNHWVYKEKSYTTAELYNEWKSKQK